jgi:hypothetical protein
VADTAREVELDVEDAADFIEMLEAAHARGDAFVWLDAVDDKRVGIPLSRLGFVEIESDHKVSVGFRS